MAGAVQEDYLFNKPDKYRKVYVTGGRKSLESFCFHKLFSQEIPGDLTIFLRIFLK